MAFGGFNTNLVHSEAETLPNVWPNGYVGQSGVVQVAFLSSKGTTTGRCVIGNSEVAVIPDGSAAFIGTGVRGDQFMYKQTGLPPGARIFLSITTTEAATSHVAYMSP